MRWLDTSPILLAPLALCASALAQADPPPAIVFRGVTVIDGTGDAPLRDRTVVVEGGRIRAVSAAAAGAGARTGAGVDADVDVPDGARVFDGRGKFLIPGLWDMHVHATASPGFASLYVANGVTGIRDMFGAIAQIEVVRERVASGELAGPRIVAAGRILDGEKPVWPGSFEAVDAAQGRAAVAEAIEEGSDFIKVYSKLSREAFFAIAEEARARGIPFAGHVPNGVSAIEASEAGQRSIEHLTGILTACSSADGAAGDRGSMTRAERNEKLVETYDADKAAALFETFASNGTWMCPTLTVLRALASLRDEGFTDDDRLRYVPPFWASFWDPQRDARFRSFTDADWAVQKRVYQKQLQVVGAMHGNKVRFLAGTDVANPYCFPGFSLHDELALLVEAGLSPMEALLTATRNPAEFLGLLDELGTVEPGKVASLVLLDADPLADIGNTERIVAVVCEGRLFDRAALDAILDRLDRGGK